MLLRTLLLICLAVPACGTADNSPPPIKLEYPAGGPPLNEHFSFYVLNVDKQDATLVDVDLFVRNCRPRQPHVLLKNVIW